MASVIAMLLFSTDFLMAYAQDGQDSQVASPVPALAELRKQNPSLSAPEGRFPQLFLNEQNLFSADQLFNDGPPVPPSAADRQIPTPPPPTVSTASPVLPSPPSAAEVLQALLPILTVAKTVGGLSLGDGPLGGLLGSGSWENARYLPSLLTTMLTRPNGFPVLRIPPTVSGSLVSPTTGPAVDHDGIVQIRCNGVRSPVCEDAPFDRIISVGENIMGIKDNRVYNILPDGTPSDPEPVGLDPALEGMSAAVSLAGSQYIFHGDQYYKYLDNAGDNVQSGMVSRPIAGGFPGIHGPIDGVFALTNDTYVFIIGNKLYYYQPHVNPPVDPDFSPQMLQSIPGAPSSVDSVFMLNRRPVLYRQGMLYELDPGRMKIKRKIPLKTADGRGWLKCTADQRQDCITVRVPTSEQPNALKRKPRQRSTLP
ncbi:uncharacterized protein LOC129593621 [Paramacrobiotus metropolitanus]|uniref:uncharacterized protein LOC129593621 n=1 Tax=Paramacrobiotus metropolitanus TaxID=2943436 RepID=UPI002445C80A|nr:uncharacterized protein LOC129593621 [Paramacrobiotus metropolitanus]